MLWELLIQLQWPREAVDSKNRKEQNVVSFLQEQITEACH